VNVCEWRRHHTLALAPLWAKRGIHTKVKYPPQEKRFFPLGVAEVWHRSTKRGLLDAEPRAVALAFLIYVSTFDTHPKKEKPTHPGVVVVKLLVGGTA
jgi:hypothetical protein